MWSLSSLAAKAQEAAARIERQLDDSVGIKDDNKSASASTSIAGAVGTHEDDLADNDDFFSENHHYHRDDATRVPTHGQHRPQGHNFPHTDEGHFDNNFSTHVETRFHDFSNDDEGANVRNSDVLQGDKPGQPLPLPQHHESGNTDEEVEFEGDDDMATGDGWNDANEIPLFDDENESGMPPMGVLENAQVIESTMSPEQESVAVVQEEIEEIDLNEEYAMSSAENGVTGFSNPIYNVVEAEMAHDHTSELESSANEVQPTDNSQANICSETNPNGEGTDESIQDDHYIPVDQRNGSTAPTEDTLVSQTRMENISAVDDAERKQYLDTIANLESQLYQRETQLASKSNQITSLSLQHEAETAELRQTISNTKEEAKKRILRAKERVDEIQFKLTEAVRRADTAGGSSQEQSDVICALRAEGEKLAKKQSQMEQLVRNARGEARDLQEQLDIEKDSRTKEVAKVESLTLELKSLKEELALARKGESQSKKLEADLLAAKEESEKQRAFNIGLEQQVKELKDENKALKKEVQDARAGAALELEGESNKLRRERNDMLEDLENKLRTSEREANVREDALRHEVSELRKRWQDAVRRAEGKSSHWVMLLFSRDTLSFPHSFASTVSDLSMDVQHSTAPLLRQLESTERQTRARAAAWAEVETKLRSDLEDHVIRLERLTKERNDFITNDKRSQRYLKEKDDEILRLRETIDALSATIESLESKVEKLEAECSTSTQQVVGAERKASEGVSKVRNELMQTLVESEERYKAQIDYLECELDGERQRRVTMERQLDDLVGSVAAAEFAQNQVTDEIGRNSPGRSKKLRKATDQASILQDTLAGFDSDVDEDDDNIEGVGNGMNQVQGLGSSFAAMEQLSLGLKGARVELETLRKQLKSLEEIRASLLEELGEARQAAEKLPLFEQKVSDLTMEVRLKEMEIQGLRDDIADVRFLYRSQLDALLEEKALPVTCAQSEKGPNNNVTVIDDSN